MADSDEKSEQDENLADADDGKEGHQNPIVRETHSHVHHSFGNPAAQ